MSDARQAERDRKAREWFANVDLPPHDWDVEALTDLLKSTEVAVLEEVAKYVLDGRFLHDKAPDALFAKKVAEMLKRQAQERRS